MKILVTGGAGFIARNLKEYFEDVCKVVAPNSRELDLLVSGKVENIIKKNKFDVILHTATYDAAPQMSIKDKTKVLEYNVRMFYNIARWKDYFGKLIYFGSGAEFDRAHWKPLMNEGYFDRYVPEDQYGFSKYVMTKYALLSNNIYNLRLFGVFGKYEDWRYRFISNMCYQALTGNKLVVRQNAFYDFTHIDDLVKVVKWAIESDPKKKVYNVCSGKAYERIAVAKIIKKVSGKDLKIEVDDPKMGREYSGSNKLLLSEMKGFKFTPIEKTVRTLFDWYNNNQEEAFKG